ncbi:hypothetical protein AVEN_65816-1 [Araneus ventricosus]|uniref:Uncharacterized protein n=1 Tax=Araneus ventricosus TaxID=182803 RepID=A0A4Y2RCC4_ARAVE|nr:hypothetical protein AVEN_65816-1 [Araneus ventricosus]
MVQAAHKAGTGLYHMMSHSWAWEGSLFIVFTHPDYSGCLDMADNGRINGCLERRNIYSVRSYQLGSGHSACNLNWTDSRTSSEITPWPAKQISDQIDLQIHSMLS